MSIFSRDCDECGQPEESFRFCESRCMLQSCPECTFLLQLYGLVAEISAFIIYAVHVMRDALRGGLLSPRKEV